VAAAEGVAAGLRWRVRRALSAASRLRPFPLSAQKRKSSLLRGLYQATGDELVPEHGLEETLNGSVGEPNGVVGYATALDMLQVLMS